MFDKAVKQEPRTKRGEDEEPRMDANGYEWGDIGRRAVSRMTLEEHSDDTLDTNRRELRRCRGIFTSIRVHVCNCGLRLGKRLNLWIPSITSRVIS